MAGNGKIAELGETARVSCKEIERLRKQAKAQGAGRHASLVIYFRDGVKVVPLRQGSAIVVGRAHPADVEVRDASLSRQHACFELEGAEVWVEDLQSTNGTWLEGRRVDRARLEIGDEVMLGTVAVTVEALAPVEREAKGLPSHDAFLRELDTEVTRALEHRRPVALLMVQSERRDGGVSRWLPRLRELLRDYDRLALYSANAVEVLLPELNEEAAVALARKAIVGPDQLVCGVARLSDRLRSGAALHEAALQALRSASLSSPVEVSRAVRPEVEVGGGPALGPVVESAAMRVVFETVDRLAKVPIPVLIHGQTGTGKEVVARAIHLRGQRRDGPFVAVNCGAIPSQLVEATLFGHERGAFTDASARVKGLFESAHGGTVLLDEVGELPGPAQAALLRVLETRRVCRVGATEEIDVDVRVLSATSRDLQAMTVAGTFRQDLLYRLEGMVITLPPLRERVADIEPLALRFMAEANRANGRSIDGITDEALEALARYDWPGNVRELRNALERAVVIAHGSTIDVEDLPERVRELDQAAPQGPGARPAPASSPPPPERKAEVVNLKNEVARFEADLILQALQESDWNRTVAAGRLGLPLRTLSHKMQVHSIKRVDRG